MCGVELSVDGRPIVEACRKAGLLINCTQERVLRMLPALTVTKTELDRAVKMLDGVLQAQQPMVRRVPAAAGKRA